MMIRIAVVDAVKMTDVRFTVPEGLDLFTFLSEYMHFTDADMRKHNIGVFGKIKKYSYKLCDNDRIEIYEKITANPKIKRKLRAKYE